MDDETVFTARFTLALLTVPALGAEWTFRPFPALGAEVTFRTAADFFAKVLAATVLAVELFEVLKVFAALLVWTFVGVFFVAIVTDPN